MLATNIKLCQVGCYRFNQAAWRSDGVNLGISWYCHLFHLFPSWMFPLAALLTKGSVKKKNPQKPPKTKTKPKTPVPAMLIQLSGPHPSVGLLFSFFLLCCPLIQPCLVELTERDFFPLSQIWGYGGPVPTMLLLSMPQESLVLLHHGKGWGLSCYGVSLLRCLTAACSPAVVPVQNIALAFIVKVGTETLGHLFWKKLAETAISEEVVTGIHEAQEYFHLITQPHTVGLVKFLYLCLCFYTCLEVLQLQKAVRRSFHLIKTGNIKPWRVI